MKLITHCNLQDLISAVFNILLILASNSFPLLTLVRGTFSVLTPTEQVLTATEEVLAAAEEVLAGTIAEDIVGKLQIVNFGQKKKKFF